MSYDIFVQDLPLDAKSIEDIPSDFKPKPIGKRSLIIEKIKEVAPATDFSDPTWGSIRGADWSIEVSMGDEEQCSGFAFHIRGGKEAFLVVKAILQKLELRALDPQMGGLCIVDPNATNAFRDWGANRDHVIGSGDE